MNLVEKLREGCVQVSKRWSGDCGELSMVDEAATDKLMQQAADRLEKLENALKRIRDCDWLPEYRLRQEAREALK